MNSVIGAPRSRQRGVVLIFSLIILLILAIGAVALLRSMNSSLLSAGNLAFHRDLVNQGEQAVANVMTEFKTGGAPLSGLTTADNSPPITNPRRFPPIRRECPPPCWATT